MESTSRECNTRHIEIGTIFSSTNTIVYVSDCRCIYSCCIWSRASIHSEFKISTSECDSFIKSHLNVNSVCIIVWTICRYRRHHSNGRSYRIHSHRIICIHRRVICISSRISDATSCHGSNNIPVCCYWDGYFKSSTIIWCNLSNCNGSDSCCSSSSVYVSVHKGDNINSFIKNDLEYNRWAICGIGLSRSLSYGSCWWCNINIKSIRRSWWIGSISSAIDTPCTNIVTIVTFCIECVCHTRSKSVPISIPSITRCISRKTILKRVRICLCFCNCVIITLYRSCEYIVSYYENWNSFIIGNIRSTSRNCCNLGTAIGRSSCCIIKIYSKSDSTFSITCLHHSCCLPVITSNKNNTISSIPINCYCGCSYFFVSYEIQSHCISSFCEC